MNAVDLISWLVIACVLVTCAIGFLFLVWFVISLVRVAFSKEFTTPPPGLQSKPTAPWNTPEFINSRDWAKIDRNGNRILNDGDRRPELQEIEPKTRKAGLWSSRDRN